MAKTLLGVCDTAVEESSTRTSWDVNKIGGKPDWMHTNPVNSLPTCRRCGSVTSLISQVYSPLDGSDYHRTLYVFACPLRTCWNQPDSWCVLRGQLLDDRHHPEESPQQDSPATESWGSGCDDWGDGDEDAAVAMVTEQSGVGGRPGNSDKAKTWCEDADDWGDTSDDDDNRASRIHSGRDVPIATTGTIVPTEHIGIASPTLDSAAMATKSWASVVKQPGKEIGDSQLEMSSKSLMTGNCRSASDVRTDANCEEAIHQAGCSELEDGILKLKQMTVEDVAPAAADEDKDEDADGCRLEHCIPDDIGVDIQASVLRDYVKKPPEASQALPSAGDGPSSSVAVTLRCFYVNVIEEPPWDTPVSSLQHERKLLAEYARHEHVDLESLGLGPERGKKGKQGKGGGAEGYEKSLARHGDAVFHKFTKRLSVCPHQVLRYQYNGSALEISSPTGSVRHAVPPCSCCGAKRLFEFQLMPALVNFLKTSDTGELAVEFGTVQVYTCSKSCWREADTLLEEHAVLQTDPDQQLFSR